MKKWMSLLLCLIVILSTLAGCSGDGNSSGGGSSTPSGTSQAGETSTPTTPSGDAKTIVISVFDRGTTTEDFGSVTDNRYIDWINETFGAPNNINVEFFGRGYQAERVDGF